MELEEAWVCEAGWIGGDGGGGEAEDGVFSGVVWSQEATETGEERKSSFRSRFPKPGDGTLGTQTDKSGGLPVQFFLTCPERKQLRHRTGFVHVSDVWRIAKQF